VTPGRLRALRRPFVVGVVYDDDVRAAAETVRRGTRDGADAFELNLPRLGCPDAEALATVVEATDRPVYTSCRRAPFTDVYGPSAHRPRPMAEEARMAAQLAALRYGSAGIDMELDTFDPHPAPPPGTPEMDAAVRAGGPPREVTEDPRAVRRQRDLIAEVHAAGAEVVLSCHTACALGDAEAERLGVLMAGRGGDLLKIVAAARDSEDTLALLRATVRMAARLSVPFTLMPVGAGAHRSRFVLPLLGAAWAFGQVSHGPGGFRQMPLVRELRAVFDAVGDAPSRT